MSDYSFTAAGESTGNHRLTGNADDDADPDGDAGGVLPADPDGDDLASAHKMLALVESEVFGEPSETDAEFSDRPESEQIQIINARAGALIDEGVTREQIMKAAFSSNSTRSRGNPDGGGVTYFTEQSAGALPPQVLTDERRGPPRRSSASLANRAHPERGMSGQRSRTDGDGQRARSNGSVNYSLQAGSTSSVPTTDGAEDTDWLPARVMTRESE